MDSIQEIFFYNFHLDRRLGSSFTCLVELGSDFLERQDTNSCKNRDQYPIDALFDKLTNPVVLILVII